MTDSAAPAQRGEVIPADAGPAILPAALVETYAALLDSVPDAGGDGMAGILEAIAEAGDLDDLDAPWRSGGLGAYVGTPLTLTGLRKMPSDYAGGLPWFLVVEGAVTATGEKITVTTGAVSVVAQLVKAWQLGRFPLRVIPRQSARPNAAGNFPQHLEIDRTPGRRGS